MMQELEPWTTTMAPAELQGIGIMIQEACQNYEGVVNLMTACSDIGTAHQKMQRPDEQSLAALQHMQMQDLLAATAEHKRELQSRQKAFPDVQQRCMAQSTLPQFADL